MRTIYLIAFLLFFLIADSVNAQQLAPSIVWQKCLGGSLDDKANAIIKNVDNGFLIVGSSKSNDGDISGHHGSTTTTDGWVVKISSLGIIEWQKSLGGSGNDMFNSVVSTNDGGYLCQGNTESTDGDVNGNHGGLDVWLVKLDRNGNILWKRCYGGTQDESRIEIGNMKKTSDGKILLIGTTASNDGDVSGNHNPGSEDIWVFKADEITGNILWQQCYGGSNADYGYDIEEAENGKFIMMVEMNSHDGEFPEIILNPPVGRIIKTDSVRTLYWQNGITRARAVGVLKTMPNQYATVYNTTSCYPANPNTGLQIGGIVDNRPSWANPSYLVQLGLGYSYCYPYLNFTPLAYQISNSNAILNISTSDKIIAAASDDSVNNNGHRGKIDGWINGFSTSFDSTTLSLEWSAKWKRLFGGSGNDRFTSIAAINEHEFVAAGYTNSNDGDVNGNHGGNDIWIVKLGSTNSIKGTVYIDYNVNGIKDANEPFANNILVESKKESVKAGSLTGNGYFRNSVDTGLFTTSVKSSIPYYTAVPSSINSSFSSYNNDDSLSFALQPIPNKKDYRVDLLPQDVARPGYPMKYIIQIFNLGTDTLQNKVVKFIKDHRTTFTSSIPTQTSISNDTVKWVVGLLRPRETTTIAFSLTIAAPPVFSFNDTLVSLAIVDSTGDLNSANNVSLIRMRGQGSHDPNDKSAANAGFMYKADVDAGQPVAYTIRFQNTGNDTAFNVVIKDTLDAKLDSNSIEMLQASHAYQLAITDGKYLTWTFNNILLPDSNRNELASHGYIVYRIKPKSNLAVGDTIKNSASIYFDFNSPVKTNTHTTVIRNGPNVPSPIITGILPEYCDRQGIQSGKLSNLPSPGSGITTRVTLDNDVLPVAGDSTFTFNINFIAIGVHKLTVTYSNAYDADTVIMSFAVRPSVAPNVNVSANITNVTNLANPVTVTATNAAGGGTTPLYTFAKDRDFTTILQNESGNNILNLNPADLQIGDNWIYVRMKSSLTCFTVQTNIDSILLKRDAVTGIIDVENPGKVINIYPNPFDREIKISGLMPTKNYELSIVGLDGKKLLQKQIQNNTQASVTIQSVTTGIYFLNLYDKRNHRLIGSVRIFKQ